MKILSIVLIITTGFFYFNIDNFDPFFIEKGNGVLGTVKGSALIVKAYLGYDMITTLAQETIDPHIAIPRAILATLATCTIIYMLVAISLTGTAKLYLF